MQKITFLLVWIFCLVSGFVYSQDPCDDLVARTKNLHISTGNSIAELHAAYFDDGSYVENDSTVILSYSFSADPLDSIILVDCDISVLREVKIYVFLSDNCSKVSDAYYFIDEIDCERTFLSGNPEDTIAPFLAVRQDFRFSPVYGDSIRIPITDIVAFSSDNQTAPSELKISFSDTHLDTVLIVSCDATGILQATIYSIDLAGNHSSVLINYIVLNSLCQPPPDTTAPSAICRDSYVLIFSDEDEIPEAILLLTSEIDAGSFDDVSDPANLIISFDPDTLQTSQFLENAICWQVFTIELFVTDEAGNQSSCSTELLIDCQVSIGENDVSNDIEVYPTIWKDELYLKINNQLNGIAKYTLFNSTGVSVTSGNVGEGLNIINKSSWIQPGWYFMHVETEYSNSVFKIIASD